MALAVACTYRVEAFEDMDCCCFGAFEDIVEHVRSQFVLDAFEEKTDFLTLQWD